MNKRTIFVIAIIVSFCLGYSHCFDGIKLKQHVVRLGVRKIQTYTTNKNDVTGKDPITKELWTENFYFTSDPIIYEDLPSNKPPYLEYDLWFGIKAIGETIHNIER